MHTREPHEDPADRAIARRLGKLAAAPVDTSGLDRALEGLLPPVRRRRSWRVGLLAVAAGLLLVFSVVIGMSFLQGQEVRASTDMMVRMHEDIVSGRVETMQVDTIEEANKAIAAMSGNFPKLPTPPASHTMACCMKSIGNKRVACVLLSDEGVPVTMSVAQASDVKSPANARAVQHEGVTFQEVDSGNLHMVMAERGDKWVCLISSASAERLMELVLKLK